MTEQELFAEYQKAEKEIVLPRQQINKEVNMKIIELIYNDERVKELKLKVDFYEKETDKIYKEKEEEITKLRAIQQPFWYELTSRMKTLTESLKSHPEVLAIEKRKDKYPLDKFFKARDAYDNESQKLYIERQKVDKDPKEWMKKELGVEYIVAWLVKFGSIVIIFVFSFLTIKLILGE